VTGPLASLLGVLRWPLPANARKEALLCQVKPQAGESVGQQVGR